MVRRHAQDAIVDCINQLEHLRDAQLRRLILGRKATLKRLCDRLDRRLAELIAEHDDLADLSHRLQSVPGVGPVLARVLIALLPELGSLTRRQVAALVVRRALRPKLGQRSAPKASMRTSHRSQSPLHGRHGGLAMESSHRSLRSTPGKQTRARSASLPACVSSSSRSTPWSGMVRDGSIKKPENKTVAPLRARAPVETTANGHIR